MNLAAVPTESSEIGDHGVIREAEPVAIDLLPVLTLVLWLFCLAVGIFGFALPYVRPHASQAAKPVAVELLNVELTPRQSMPEPSAPSHPEAVAASDIPPALSVARPSASIAFAVPVAAPAEISDARSAVSSMPSALPAPTRLTFGEGEGRQPAPEYPLRAQREGQEGTVVVRFFVNETGNVMAADITQSCPWPLLNASAADAIRERWHFSPGAMRTYEVAIHFKLTK